MQLKKIIIPDIYLEPGINFKSFYNYQIHVKLQDSLNNSFIEDGLMLTKYKDYQLIISISPTMLEFSEIQKKILPVLYIKDNYMICSAHITRQKNYKAIEFFVYLKYEEFLKSINPIEKYLLLMRDYLSFILTYLKYQEDNIKKVVNGVEIK